MNSDLERKIWNIWNVLIVIFIFQLVILVTLIVILMTPIKVNLEGSCWNIPTNLTISNLTGGKG